MKTARAGLVIMIACGLAACFAGAAGAEPATTGWTTQTSGTTQDLKGVCCLDAAHGWAVGAGGVILASADGGATWAPMASGTTRTLWVTKFIDARRGWVAGDAGTVVATQDAGQTWVDLNAWRASGMDVHSGMVAPDGGYAIGVGSGGGIIATNNGGEDGIAMASGTTADLWGVSYSDVKTGWIVGAQGTIIHTIDKAYSWTAQVSGTTQTLFGVVFCDSTHGWAVGGAGTILVTTNGGQTWSAQTTGTTDDLYSVAFADLQHGWVAGDHGTILVTIDGGVHWTKVASGTTSLLRSVHFVNDQAGWAVGDDGTILVTTNGGVPPDSTAPTTTSDAGTGWYNADVAVHFTASDGPEGSGIVATEYSTDNGSTWTEGTLLTVPAPADHSGDGVHEIRYRSSDLAGNLEAQKSCQVKVDTTAPSISGLKPIVAKKGKTATIRLRIDDLRGATALSPVAAVTMTVKDSRGKVKKVVDLGVRPTNRSISCVWKCKLARGRYSITITAVDAAGNPQAKAVTGRLTVT